MKNRVTSDGANPVNLFPFLAVLLCTMGALLVLLVVLAERAGKRVVAEAGRTQPVAMAEVSHNAPARTLPVLAAPAPTPEQIAAAEAAKTKARELNQQLEAARTRQKTLAAQREKIKKQLFEEQQRLAHLEDHTRRLEHELAKLHVASEHLKETEGKQTVDQQQAERELKRLKKLIAENETQLDKLRNQAGGKKSYAITPYDGKSGTSDPRIFIECTREGITLQPEGLEFVAKDFVDEQSPDSPLSAAVRATRGHLREKAIAAGESNPPYAVALILVWPDGEQALYSARSALEAAGESYGIEYLSSKGEINYPVDLDPLLAETQHHAIMIARERLDNRIRSAPSRFRKKLERIVTNSVGRGQNSQGVATLSNNTGVGNSASGNATAGAIDQSGESYNTGWAAAQLAGQSTGQAVGSQSEGASQPQIGAMTGNGNSTDPNGALAGEPGTYNEQSVNAQGNVGGSSESGGPASGSGSQTAAGTSASASNQASSSGAPSASGATAQQSQEMKSSEGAGANRYASAQSSGSEESASPSGDDWALPSKRRLSAVPLQRPIRVVVRKDFVAFLPGRGTDETGQQVSIQQSPKQVSKEIVSALKKRMNEWGIAGNDLYWKPVLILSVAPDATRAADRFKQLMKNSGVAIRVSENTQMSQRGQENATY